MSWNAKYPSNRFNHLSTTSACIWPSNMGMPKFTCTLKGVPPPEWPLDADEPPMGNHWRIWAKLSIIAFLCFSRAPSTNILIGSPAPSSFFSSPMGGCRGLRGWSCKGSTRSSPTSLYPDLVEDMQKRIEKAQTALIPLIWIYAGTQQNTEITMNTKMQWK